MILHYIHWSSAHTINCIAYCMFILDSKFTSCAYAGRQSAESRITKG